jgi:hypothetical protein
LLFWFAESLYRMRVPVSICASMMRFISCCAGIFSRYRLPLVALVQLVELGATDVSQPGASFGQRGSSRRRSPRVA